MNNYELLIFDWDGTLVDSIGRIVESILVAATKCDLPRLDENSIKGIIGLGLPEAIAVLYPGETDRKLVEAFRRAYADHYLALESEPSALYPGVATALQHFRDQGHQLAVATGKGRRGLDRVLAGQGWSDFFDVTRCADETASKPDPLMIHEILEHCGVSPERALMIGDSVFDLEMARRAGVDSVAVSYGAQPLEVLLSCSPRMAINHFSELGEWLCSAASPAEVVTYVG
ncbi:HAD-IA family hydrolase [Pseudomonas stutzeri]|uniref:HAD-IA family hydrolase n=1 Tax=Stutzerimonas stutzeri TaxID=316 RepID=UPI000C9C81AC|nr:HAD-IA family hydrolase [Stutzerimonas stutzeri]MCQ4279043.1 HAD-IA family hydrolase [Stutzerimonas stutzeri]PNF74649.1 HAD family hydrolase [Stutzerimonas stutzeri]